MHKHSGLTLNDDTFSDLKFDFDSILRRTLANMDKKDSNESEITLKLSISLKKEIVHDIPYEERTAVKPSFSHKIVSVIKAKDEVAGKLNGDYELVWDDELQNYVMKEIRDRSQVSMFDNE